MTIQYYTYNNDNCIEVTALLNNVILCQIDCLINSPYSIEEEIQNWIDEDDMYKNQNFEFQNITN